MILTTPNSTRPRYGHGMPFATFRISLTRDGDDIVLKCEHPQCHRDFHAFTPKEKDAYNAVLAFVVDEAGKVFHRLNTTESR